MAIKKSASRKTAKVLKGKNLKLTIKKPEREYYIANVVFNNDFSGVRYSYKVPNDVKVTVGDAVVVKSPYSGLTVVHVAAVHEGNYIQKEAELSYKWIVQAIDTERYNKNTSADANKKASLEQLAKVRREINELCALVPESSEQACAALKKLESLV